MGYIIGTDEAGYGPNLGPLVIAASAWRVPGRPQDADLYDLLQNAVSAEADGQRLHLADSKAVYQPAGGLGPLELGVLAAASVAGVPATWRGAWDRLCPESQAELAAQPWHAEHDEPLPIEADEQAISARGTLFQTALRDAGVELVALRACAVFPARFNACAAADSSKGETLTRLTLGLAAALANELTAAQPDSVLLVCDKHGGRNRYAAHLQAVFDDFIRVRCEGRDESRYDWGPPERRLEASFRTRSERFLPAALASMTAKYLRELSMRAFNAWWQARAPGLRPTAGYPQDARRFRTDIAEVQRKLKIADDILWRVK